MKFFWVPVVFLLFANKANSTSQELDVIKPLTIVGKLQQIIKEIINLPIHFVEAAINAFNGFIQALDDPEDKEVWQETSKTIITDVGTALSKSLELLPKITSIVENTASCISDAFANVKVAVSHVKDILLMLLKVLLQSLLDTLKFALETLRGSRRLAYSFITCPSIQCKVTSLIDIFKFAQKQIVSLFKITKNLFENIISAFKTVLEKVLNGVTESLEKLKLCFLEDKKNQLQVGETSLVLGSRSISSDLKEIQEVFLKTFKELLEIVLNRINDMNDNLSTAGKETLMIFVQTIQAEIKTLIGGFQETPEKFKNVLDKVKSCFNSNVWWHGPGILAKLLRLKSCWSEEKIIGKIRKNINQKLAEYTSLQKKCSSLKYKDACIVGVATNIPAKIGNIIEIIIDGILKIPSNLKELVKCVDTELTGLIMDKLYKFMKAIDKCVK